MCHVDVFDMVLCSHIDARIWTAQNFGWELKDDIPQPVYYTGLLATEKLDSLVCKCTNICRNRCDCKENQLPCLPSICNCELDCENTLQGDEDDTDDEQIPGFVMCKLYDCYLFIVFRKIHFLINKNQNKIDYVGFAYDEDSHA